jgi:hypothetical protein
LAIRLFHIKNPHVKHACQQDKSHGDREDHQTVEPAEVYTEATDNAGAIGWRLSEEEFRQIDEASRRL